MSEPEIKSPSERIRELERDLKIARDHSTTLERQMEERLQNEIVGRYFMYRDDMESKYFHPIVTSMWSGVCGELFVMPRADTNSGGGFSYGRHSYNTMGEGWTPISFKEYEDARLRFFSRLLAEKKKRPTREEMS